MAIAIGLNPAWVTGTTGTSLASAAFSPVANSLIVVESHVDTSLGSITPNISDSVGLTWTEIGTVQRGVSGAFVAVFWAFTASAQTNMTATGGWSAASGQTKAIKVTTYTGTASASAVISKAQNSSGTNNLSVNVTNTNDQCRMSGSAVDFNALGAPTSTDDEVSYHASGLISGTSVKKAANTTGTGQTVGMNFDAGGSGSADWGYKIYEIVPAAGGTTSVSSDLDLRWISRAQVTSTLDLRWRSATVVTSDLDVRWRSYTTVTSDLDVRWRSYTSVASLLDLRWICLTRVQSDFDARWRVATVVTADHDFRWRTATLVTSAHDFRWTVATQVTSDHDFRWRTATVVTSQLDIRWLVDNTVTSDLDLRWVVDGGGISVVTSDLDLRWRSLTRVNSDLSLPWRVATLVSSDHDLRWAVRMAVTSDHDLRWLVWTGVTSQLDIRWVVLTRVQTDHTFRWIVLSDFVLVPDSFVSLKAPVSVVDLRDEVSQVTL